MPGRDETPRQTIATYISQVQEFQQFILIIISILKRHNNVL